MENQFNEELRDEIKYLNHNELIDIKDIILKHVPKEKLYQVSNGLMINLDIIPIECKREIKYYIEDIYKKLNDYRKQYCDLKINTKEFKFVDL